MKKVLSLIIFSFYFYAQPIAQPVAQPDLQWLILDGKGKSGTTPSGSWFINNYPASNAMTANLFSLSGVSHPNRNCYNKTKNDIFIIYSDGSFFLSRAKFNVATSQYQPDYFFPGTQGNLGDVIHNITIPQGQTASYMYLANIYEGDDPPDLVSVRNSHIQNAQNYTLVSTSIFQIPAFGVSSVPQLSNPQGVIAATHDITKNSDATLILNANVDKLTKDDTLFVSLFDLSGNQYIQGTFFDTVNIFDVGGGKSFASFPGVSFNGSYFTFNQLQDSRPPYIFLNLHPSDDCHSFFPGQPENPYADSSRYVAVFTLKNGTRIKGVTNEYLMDSHDPNFCKVESICEDSKGNQVVNYHIQFKNQSLVPANQLEIQFDLPPFFDSTCIHLSDIHAGTSRATASLRTSNNRVTITYNPDAQVQTCAAEDTTNCTGWIKFCVRVTDPKIDLTNVSNSLALHNTSVSFNGTRYPIRDFHDKVKYDPPAKPFRVYDQIDCACACIKFPTGLVIGLSVAGIALALYAYSRLKKS